MYFEFPKDLKQQATHMLGGLSYNYGVILLTKCKVVAHDDLKSLNSEAAR